MLEKIKKIADYFPFCLTIVDVSRKGRPCLFANKIFFENTGYLPNEVVGRNLAFLQGSKTQIDTINFMKKCFENNEACIQDIVNYKKNGTEFINRLLLIPIKDKSEGELYLGIQNNVSERYLSNVDLSKINSAEIHHIINNALTVIISKLTMKLYLASDEKSISDAVKSLSHQFERINSYVLNIEKVSLFENFCY